MKQHHYAVALLLLSTGAHAENYISGKSFFSDLQDYSLFSQRGYMMAREQASQDGYVINRTQFSASVFGSRSYDEDNLRRYFAFNNKNVLHVKESIPTSGIQEIGQDLLFADFNVQTDNGAQESYIFFNPKQTRAGIAFSWRKAIKDKYWVTVDAPFVHLENNLDLVEAFTGTVHTRSSGLRGFELDGTGGAQNPTAFSMFGAFKQTGLNYGRVDGPRKKDGLADLTVRFGYNSVNRSDLFMSQNIGVIIPTGNRAKAVYMWEPIVGNGHHAGITGGTTTHFRLKENKKRNTQIWITGAVDGTYLFENTQKRSLDLKNGPWTRYLAMFENATKRASNLQTFGINLMTRDVKVDPGASAQFATQVSLLAEHWNINLGFISRYRQAETVRLAQEWELGPEIADLAPTSATVGEVNPLRKMGRALTNYTLGAGIDSFITEEDIDFDSAAHPSVISYTLHGSLAYYHHTAHPQNYELGFAYDFANQNTAINRAMVWAKLQLTF